MTAGNVIAHRHDTVVPPGVSARIGLPIPPTMSSRAEFGETVWEPLTVLPVLGLLGRIGWTLEEQLIAVGVRK